MMSNMVGETSAEFLDSWNAKLTFDDLVLNASCGLLVCGRRFKKWTFGLYVLPNVYLDVAWSLLTYAFKPGSTDFQIVGR